MRLTFGGFGLTLAACALVYAVFEAALRLAQGGCYAYLPYRIDDGFPVLPRSASFCFINTLHARIAYATDSQGARRKSAAEARGPCTHCVMTVGDSQALGYGIAYEDTFTARYAARDGRPSVLVAAPLDDPDTERLAAAHYLAATRTAPQTLFVVVNMGNDVDELFLGRRGGGIARSGASSWLPEHSFVYADLAVAGRIFTRLLVHSGAEPPDTNPVVYALEPGEVPVFANALARDVEAILRETRARSALVIVVPPDYVVDARQFEKYRQYYSATQFSSWRARLPYMTRVMAALEDGLDGRLRADGVRTLDLRALLSRISAPLGFDSRSHHLTPLANAMIAAQIK